MCIRDSLAAQVARDAGLFLVDDRGQFLANRDAGLFDGYPDPTATLGEAILAGTARPAAGRAVTVEAEEESCASSSERWACCSWPCLSRSLRSRVSSSGSRRARSRRR